MVRIADDGEDLIIVSLFDGSLHIIRDGCTIPTLNSMGTERADSSEMNELLSKPTSMKLTQLVRRAFARTESECITSADVGRIGGMADFDDTGTLVWMHEYVSIPFSLKSSRLIEYIQGDVGRMISAMFLTRNEAPQSPLRSYGTNLWVDHY